MVRIWWDQQSMQYYELLQLNTIVTAELYREQMIVLSRAMHYKRPEWAKRHTNGILLQDKARPHAAKIVKNVGVAWLGSFASPALFSGYWTFGLAFAPIDAKRFTRTAF